MHPGARNTPGPAAQRGLSLVELMVGAALALLIVAAASELFASQLREQRRLALETRLVQDLRSAADLIGRDLRRAGHWGSAADGIRAAGADSVATNPYTALAPIATAANAASYRYSRDAVENQRVDSHEQFGVRLRSGVLELALGAGNWQALTDPATLTVTALSIEPVTQSVDLSGFCVRPCTAALACVPPTLRVRSLVLTLSARLVADAGIARVLRSAVRLRNDVVDGACPA